MRNIIVIILVLIGFAAYAQPSNSSQYLNQTAKWKFVKPQWLDSGMYIKNITAQTTADSILVAKGSNGKVGYRLASSILTDTTSLSNRINLKLNISDTAGMLSPYALSSEVPTYLAGNGIIKGGSTFYNDSLKFLSLHGYSGANGTFIGTTLNRSVRFRVNNLETVIIDSNQRIQVTQPYATTINSLATTISRGNLFRQDFTGTKFGVSIGGNSNGYGFVQTVYGSSSEVLLLNPYGSNVAIGGLGGNTNLLIGTISQIGGSGCKLAIPISPTASANYGLVSLGSGAFNGSTSGYFTGSASGTVLAVNAASGFVGDLVNLQIAGVSSFKVGSGGTTVGTLTAGIVTANVGLKIAASQDLTWLTRSAIQAPSAGVLLLTDAPAYTSFNRLQFGGTTSSFPALKRSTTTIEVRLADDSGYGATQSLYDRFGSGSPESVVTAPIGAIYHRTDGGAGTSLYVKESGTGNTGWIAK